MNGERGNSSSEKSGRRPRTLVTGAALRVGLATALEFASRGHAIVLAVRRIDDRSQAALLAVQQAARAAGHADAPIEVHAADLDDVVAVQALGVAVAQGPLDVVVHCAARYRAQPIGSIEPDQALSDYRVNALAPLLLTQALAPRLAKSILPAGGAVVCFTDMHVEGRLYSSHAAYFASKGAVSALVQAMAVELAPLVRVNGIAPGVVAWPEGADEEFKKRYIAKTPLGRAGSPDEAAKCAAWLALDASFLTGVVIRLDGGRWLKG
ncbi:MAG: SDR family oxidoreductase [Phycisphaerales bacterium]|nr:SDR family oxidoreductase [Phycisphaerales bacterium]